MKMAGGFMCWAILIWAVLLSTGFLFIVGVNARPWFGKLFWMLCIWEIAGLIIISASVIFSTNGSCLSI